MSSDAPLNALAKREHEMELQAALINSGKFPTCVSCIQFNKEKQECEMYKSRPPLAWVVTGCNRWEMGIPF